MAPRLAGIVTTAAGIGLFTSNGGAFGSGHLILVGTGIRWATYTLLVRRSAVPALNAAAIIAVGSAVAYVPVYLIAMPKEIATAPLLDITLQAVFQGVLVSVVAIYAFNRSAELLGPVAGATLPAMIPVVTMALGHLFLGESVGLMELVGAFVTAGGVALILVGRPLAEKVHRAFDATNRHRRS